jgi:tRNA A-37 threonylcarbamoyl transferase component Bud32
MMPEQLEEGIILQDRYRIAKMLGGGGMGQVYLAHDTRLADKPCAIKELIPDPHLSPEEAAQDAAQFHREAAVLAHLSHVNLPDVSDYFEERERFYLVMDFVEGVTLADRLEESPGGLAQDAIIEWAVQLCDVLEYLHQQDPPVIFRDMKPSNVMLPPDGNVKLIDFGVVRLFDPDKGTDTLKMGTAGYAPPEQYAGQGQTTPRSDVYALGATLYELLTGDSPTAHPFVFESPQKLKPSISQSLAGIVMRAVSLDPQERFASASEMKDALQKVTRPRRFQMPAFLQRQRGTGTSVMPATAALPRQRSRFAEFALGVGRWVLRFVLSVALALLVTAIILILVGALVISLVAENAIATADWQWEYARSGETVYTEEQVNEDVYVVLEPYMLDMADSTHVDFVPPDSVLIDTEISGQVISVEIHIRAEDGRPVVVLDRINGKRPYIVGGIITGGVNRGLEKAFEDAPVQLDSIVFSGSRVIVELE